MSEIIALVSFWGISWLVIAYSKYSAAFAFRIMAITTLNCLSIFHWCTRILIVLCIKYCLPTYLKYTDVYLAVYYRRTFAIPCITSKISCMFGKLRAIAPASEMFGVTTVELLETDAQMHLNRKRLQTTDLIISHFSLLCIMWNECRCTI